MNRHFSSNTSVNLIQLDTDLEFDHRFKSNSLVEMFDPIFDKQFQNSSNNLQQSIGKSTSSNEDIFAPKSINKDIDLDSHRIKLSDDELFVEINIPENKISESLYPNLSSFKTSYSSERYSVFEEQNSDRDNNTSYDLRPSLFKVLTLDSNCTNLFCDGYAHKDMERFMKNVTELHMQALNLETDQRSHLIFDLTSSADVMTSNGDCRRMRIAIDLSDSIRPAIEPFVLDIDVFIETERDLMKKTIDSLSRSLDTSKLFFRIFGRGEYLNQGEFPLIKNQSIFLSYRKENNIKLVLEQINFTDSKYKLNENLSMDASTSVYQILDQHFYNIPRHQIENGFLAMNSYRNSVATMLREYRSNNMDLQSIEASLNVFMDKCRTMCLICHYIYTATIAQQILDLESMVSTMKIAYASKVEVALARSVENLIKGLDCTINVMIQMIHEITIFCNCNFSVRPDRLCLAGLQASQSGIQPISKCRTQFCVKLGSICKFNDVANYSAFYIKLTIKAGRQPLSHFLNSKLHTFLDTQISGEAYSQKSHPKYPLIIPFNETVSFENLIMLCLPVETTLLIHVYGRLLQTQGFQNKNKDTQSLPDELVGWAEVPLFDSAGMLQQGKLLVGIWPTSKKPKLSHGINRLISSAVLEVELPDFHVPVKYTSDTTLQLGEIPYLKPTKTESDKLKTMINTMWLENNPNSAKDACDMLWKHRGHLMHTPRKYIALCLTLVSAWPSDVDCENKDFLLNYIERCSKIMKNVSLTEILHLLGSQMPLIKIRKWAVQTLREIGPDECISFIPWLVEALKYDLNLNSSCLENLLLYFSLININFSTSLFWQLSSVSSDDVHGYKAMLLLGMLRTISNSATLDMWNSQLIMVENLQKTATAVKTFKGSTVERKNIMHLKLEELYDLLLQKSVHYSLCKAICHPLSFFRIPYHPGLVLEKMEMKDCSYFNSFTLPLRIVFKGIDDSLSEVMFKSGDDLRQDILVLQLFKLMDEIWISEGLDLRMVHYRVMSTGHRCGLVELVGDCTTLRKIQESKGIAAPLTSISGIREWLKCQNTTKAAYLQSVNNFLLTCAACCVSTYLLGIGDRHNDNIMIQTSGCVFHIDFAKILGDAQTFAGIKRDRVPFVLTQDMVHVLEDYQSPTNDRRTGMQLLIDKCCEAYNIIRRHWSSMMSILSMAADANIPGVNSKSIQYVVKMLRLECSDIQASEQFTELIRKSVNSISTPMNFLFHNLAQMKYSSNNEGSLFSFTPKIHRNGPRILNISVKTIKKVRQPNKHYTYQIWVTKDKVSKPEIVFRKYEHFIELGQQLASMFPLSTLPTSCQTIVQAGVPNSIVGAEGRKVILQQFVSHILTLEDEICQCDLMQTFFHSTLFDEQFVDEDNFVFLNTDTAKCEYPEIQIKFQISAGSNRGSKLEIFVKHARNLNSSRLNELPNPYVKTYILPGYIGKKKTNVVMKNSSPSFNDIITYNIIDIRHDTKIEVSVWHNETLGENFCIGSTVVPIAKNMSDKEKWYRLVSPKLEIDSLNRNTHTSSQRIPTRNSMVGNTYPGSRLSTKENVFF